MTNTSHFSSSPPNSIAAGWYPDPSTGVSRWWNGLGWTDNYQTTPIVPIASNPYLSPAVQSYPRSNGLALASLILGVAGWALMGIPYFIGWLLGGPLDIAAVILGILAIVKSNEEGGTGRGMAITGVVFASVSLMSVFVGAGSIW